MASIGIERTNLTVEAVIRKGIVADACFKRDSLNYISYPALNVRNPHPNDRPTMVTGVALAAAIRIHIVPGHVGLAAVIASVDRLVRQLDRSNIDYPTPALVLDNVLWSYATKKLLARGKNAIDRDAIPQHFMRHFMHRRRLK